MNFELPSDSMFANRLQLVLMFVMQWDTGIPIMLSYTQTRWNSCKKNKKHKASDIFLESQSRNRICNQILMNVSQIVHETRSDDAFSSSLLDELCDDTVENLMIGVSSSDDRS